MLKVPATAPRVIATEEPAACPGCNSPLVRTTLHDRICNCCGFVCTVQTAEDELDMEADRAVMTREFNEERARKIHGGQTRW